MNVGQVRGRFSSGGASDRGLSPVCVRYAPLSSLRVELHV